MSTTQRRNALIVLSAGILCGAACSSLIDPVAEETFMASLGQTTITVFPAYLRIAETEGYDADVAADVAAFLADEDLAETAVSEDEVPITGPWHSNQMQMWRESGEAFGEYVQANPISTEYAFLAEYIFLGGTGAVGGVHCYVVDSQGTLAYGFLLNSHHSNFAEIDPQNAEDCTALLITVLRDDLLAP